MTGCVVCTAPVVHFADGIVLRDRHASYVRCTRCGAVAADQPDWLDEAYSSAIASQDLGLLDRSRKMADLVVALLRLEGRSSEPLLDWGGGYGTLTRMLRDRGIAAVTHDDLCENLFAVGFEADLTARYGYVTAVEVLEHLADPYEALKDIAQLSDRLLVTTLRLPEPAPLPDQWWYYTPGSGQHIVLYTSRALHELAARLGMKALVVNADTHLLYRGRLARRTRMALRMPRLLRVVGGVGTAVSRSSGLLEADAGLG